MKDYVNLYYDCGEVGCDIMRISYDVKEKDFLYISLFGHNLHHSFCCWSNRLRHIWKIIVTGVPYEDEFLLTQDQAKKLMLDLQEFTK